MDGSNPGEGSPHPSDSADRTPSPRQATILPDRQRSTVLSRLVGRDGRLEIWLHERIRARADHPCSPSRALARLCCCVEGIRGLCCAGRGCAARPGRRGASTGSQRGWPHHWQDRCRGAARCHLSRLLHREVTSSSTPASMIFAWTRDAEIGDETALDHLRLCLWRASFPSVLYPLVWHFCMSFSYS